MTDQNNFKLHPQLAADTFVICDLPLCRALLMNEQQFPWVILVPRIENATEQYKLSKEQRLQLDIESTLVANELMTIFNGDKMNVAALGNMVPQLHIHHVVRTTTDTAWPAPVWGNFTAQPYSPNKANELVELIRMKLKPVQS